MGMRLECEYLVRRIVYDTISNAKKRSEKAHAKKKLYRRSKWPRNGNTGQIGHFFALVGLGTQEGPPEELEKRSWNCKR